MPTPPHPRGGFFCTFCLDVYSGQDQVRWRPRGGLPPTSSRRRAGGGGLERQLLCGLKQSKHNVLRPRKDERKLLLTTPSAKRRGTQGGRRLSSKTDSSLGQPRPWCRGEWTSPRPPPRRRWRTSTLKQILLLSLRKSLRSQPSHAPPGKSMMRS